MMSVLRAIAVAVLLFAEISGVPATPRPALNAQVSTHPTGILRFVGQAKGAPPQPVAAVEIVPGPDGKDRVDVCLEGASSELTRNGIQVVDLHSNTKAPVFRLMLDYAHASDSIMIGYVNKTWDAWIPVVAASLEFRDLGTKEAALSHPIFSHPVLVTGYSNSKASVMCGQAIQQLITEQSHWN